MSANPRHYYIHLRPKSPAAAHKALDQAPDDLSLVLRQREWDVLDVWRCTSGAYDASLRLAALLPSHRPATDAQRAAAVRAAIALSDTLVTGFLMEKWPGLTEEPNIVRRGGFLPLVVGEVSRPRPKSPPKIRLAEDDLARSPWTWSWKLYLDGYLPWAYRKALETDREIETQIGVIDGKPVKKWSDSRAVDPATGEQLTLVDVIPAGAVDPAQRALANVLLDQLSEDDRWLYWALYEARLSCERIRGKSKNALWQQHSRLRKRLARTYRDSPLHQARDQIAAIQGWTAGAPPIYRKPEAVWETTPQVLRGGGAGLRGALELRVAGKRKSSPAMTLLEIKALRLELEQAFRNKDILHPARLDEKRRDAEASKWDNPKRFAGEAHPPAPARSWKPRCIEPACSSPADQGSHRCSTHLRGQETAMTQAKKFAGIERCEAKLQEITEGIGDTLSLLAGQHEDNDGVQRVAERFRRDVLKQIGVRAFAE